MDSSSSCCVMLCFKIEEEVVDIRNGWTPKKMCMHRSVAVCVSVQTNHASSLSSGSCNLLCMWIALHLVCRWLLRYITPLSTIIDSNSITHHSFAYDLQLQMSAPPNKKSELLYSMQSCISDIKAWATATCKNLMTTRQNSCLSPQKEQSISITYIL